MRNSLLSINTNLKNIITEELDYVFDSRIKAVSEFLFDASAQKVQEYSVSVFDDFLIFDKDIEDAELRIKTRICNELEVSEELPELNSYINLSEQYERVLSPIIRRYKVTNRITSASEYAIDEAFSLFIGKVSSNNIVELASGKIGIGDWLLAGNSRKSQVKRLQETIFNHIKGLLINLRIQMENEMIKKWSFWDAMEDGIAV